jgi:hypothetical protein
MPVNGVLEAMKASAASEISLTSSLENWCVQRSGLLVYSVLFHAVGCEVLALTLSACDEAGSSDSREGTYACDLLGKFRV